VEWLVYICLKKKDKQWSTKHYTVNYKWNRTIPIETVEEHRCSIRIVNSFSTNDTCCLSDVLSINKTFDTNVAGVKHHNINPLSKKLKSVESSSIWFWKKNMQQFATFVSNVLLILSTSLRQQVSLVEKVEQWPTKHYTKN
jgi:hypothetical protein